MDDYIILTNAFLIFPIIITANVCSVTLALSTLIRLALRWHSNWMRLTAALLAALPQAYLVMSDSENMQLLINLTPFTIIAAILHFMATRGHRKGQKIALDASLFVLVLVYAVNYGN